MRKYKYLLLFFALSFVSAFGQFKLKQIEPCKDQAGNRVDSCFTMTDSEGFQYYISYTDLINVVKNGGGSFTCDSVAACIQSSGILCSALLQIPSGAIASGDYVFGKNGSSCKKILLDSIISQNNLCSKLAFPVTTVSNSDYFLIKKANGDCRRVLASGVVGKVNCDSVEACLASGSLCDVLRGFSSGSPANGDSIIFIKNGTCRKGLINSLIGGMYNCDSVKACIGNGTWFCDSVENCLKDGSLCAGLRSFASGTYQAGDSIWFSHNGVCRKGLIDDLIGGGGGSLNCDSVKQCLSDGALCDAIGDLSVDGGGNTWYLVGRNSDGDCARIPWDSVSAACKVELEAAEFGGNSDGCEFATTCDGGNSYSNIFWMDFTTTGTKLELNANAQGGGQNCKMTEIDLPLTVTNLSACTNGGVNLKFSVAWMGSTTNIDLGTIKLVQQGTLIKLLYNDVQCGSSACGVSCNPLTAPTNNTASADYPTIQKVDLKKLKRYKNHVLADQDKSLPSGGLYLVGNSRSIQVKL